MAAHVVTAAAIVARDGTPYGESYYYRGAVLGPGVSDEEKQRLVDAGLVSVAGEVEVIEPVEDEAPARRGRRS